MLNSIELFCGVGGLALGLQRAGFDHKALYEWNRCSCDNIKLNIVKGFAPVRHWKVYNMDVRDIDYGAFADKIQLVSGGPPCQPFSMGGKARAYKDSRDMFPEAVRAVRELRPEAFVFENVKGLLRKSFSTYFNYILLQLSYPDLVRRPGMDWEEHLRQLECYHTSNSVFGLKYKVVFRLLNVADYGVPQSRHRVVLVGFRDDVDAGWAFPAPTHSREKLLYEKWVTGSYWKKRNLASPDCSLSKRQLDALACLQPKRAPWRTVRDAIGDLPDPRSAEAGQYANHEFRSGAKRYAGHSGSLLDEPSKTIKAGVHGVPGGENMVVLDDGSLRYYTVRESARIQTFDDHYVFGGAWSENMRQIGNAVPVKLAGIIGKSVAAHLEGVRRCGKGNEIGADRAI